MDIKLIAIIIISILLIIKWLQCRSLKTYVLALLAYMEISHGHVPSDREIKKYMQWAIKNSIGIRARIDDELL